MDTSVYILDKLTKKRLDILAVVLLVRSRENLLPELLEIFGREAALKFLDIFGGCSFKVPAREELERAVRDTEIYLRLTQSKRPGDSWDEAVVKELMDRYDLTREHLFDTFQSVRAMFDPSLAVKRDGKQRQSGKGTSEASD